MLHAGVRGAQLYVHANGANAGICQMELGCCRMYTRLPTQEASAYMAV